MGAKRKSGLTHYGDYMLDGKQRMNDDLWAELIQRLSDGEFVKQICLDEHMPGNSRITRECVKWEDRKDEFAKARWLQMDVLAEDTILIADNDDDPHRARVRVAARQWLTAKLKPETYGNNVDIKITEQPSISGALAAADKRRKAIVLAPSGHVDDAGAQVLEVQGELDDLPSDIQSLGKVNVVSSGKTPAIDMDDDLAFLLS